MCAQQEVPGIEAAAAARAAAHLCEGLQLRGDPVPVHLGPHVHHGCPLQLLEGLQGWLDSTAHPSQLHARRYGLSGSFLIASRPLYQVCAASRCRNGAAAAKCEQSAGVGMDSAQAFQCLGGVLQIMHDACMRLARLLRHSWPRCTKHTLWLLRSLWTVSMIRAMFHALDCAISDHSKPLRPPPPETPPPHTATVHSGEECRLHGGNTETIDSAAGGEHNAGSNRHCTTALSAGS